MTALLTQASAKPVLTFVARRCVTFCCHLPAIESLIRPTCCITERSNIVALEHGTRVFRTLFISDVHLGTRGCQAERLLHFLRHHDADTIYLVGDIVDGWQLRQGWYWPQPHNDVVQKLLRKARKGARLVYVPGNHDEFLRGYYGTHFGGIEVVENIDP